MTSQAKARTLGELKQSGYRVSTVKEEMRRNLIERIRKGRPLFDGIYGYEESVVPQLEVSGTSWSATRAASSRSRIASAWGSAAPA